MIEFEWDGHNIGHLADHGVTPAEFEAVILDPRTIYTEFAVSENGEERFRVSGLAHNGRMISAVYTIRQGKIRAVTAFPAIKKEILKWQMQSE